MKIVQATSQKKHKEITSENFSSTTQSQNLKAYRFHSSFACTAHQPQQHST
jgi:hypothetical protein